MNANVSFHNVDHSAALIHFIENKSKSIKRFMHKGEHFNWVIEKDAQGFKPKLLLKLNNKKESLSSHSKDIHKAVQEIVSKAKRQLVREHRKRKSHF